MRPVKRTSHAVYDLTNHFVWIPKCRKTILTEAMPKEWRRYLNKWQIYELEIETMVVVENRFIIYN